MSSISVTGDFAKMSRTEGHPAIYDTLSWVPASPPWLAFLPYVLAARFLLSLAAAAHSRAVEHAEGAFHQLKRAAAAAGRTARSDASFGRIARLAGLLVIRDFMRRSGARPRHGSRVWRSFVLLPLLAAGRCALFGGYCRHLFLHESQPKQRAIQGASLAAAAAAAAAHARPPAAALPAEDLWSALLSSPAVSSLGLVGLGLLVTEAVSHAQMLTQLRDLATLYAAEAALFGSLAALAVAALGSCLRFELNQLRHRLFNTPCVFLLAGVGAASLHMQGRRLRSAYAVGERNAVSRAHAIALMLTAPLVIAAVLTGGPNSSSSEGGGGVAAPALPDGSTRSASSSPSH